MNTLFTILEYAALGYLVGCALSLILILIWIKKIRPGMGDVSGSGVVKVVFFSFYGVILFIISYTQLKKSKNDSTRK